MESALLSRRFAALAALFLPACGEKTPVAETAPGEWASLTVAVASSMRPAFEEIAKAFVAERPGTVIQPSYGASGTFYAQLVQRAPFDLFLSADREFPEKLVDEGHATASFPYATGRLVLWAPKDLGLDIAARGMEALQDPRVAKISIANPELAPYGRAALQAIKALAPGEAVVTKRVQAENVGQAAQFVQSGAAQAGLFAYSLTFTAEMRDRGDLWLVPESAHDPIEQSGVILPWSRSPVTAAALRDFILGAKGREILERHGFAAP